MMLGCENCFKEVNTVHITADGLVRLCSDCWERRGYLTERIAQLKKAKEDKLRLKLERCNYCYLQTNDCMDHPQFGRVCKDCLQDMEALSPNIHIILKLKGNAKAQAYFHFMMGKLDLDWPWEKEKQEICEKCGGVKYAHPIVDVKELETIALLCGVGKIKIKQWKKEIECHA